MGLYLYGEPALDFVLESLLAIGGWWLLRRTGRTPRWATGVAALAAVLALQGVLDVIGSRGGGAKPTACGEAATLAIR